MFPFESRYKMQTILNYGKPYSNYSSYNIMINDDSIKTIYVDNIPCSTLFTNDLPFYVEIHYTPESNKPILETVLHESELNNLLSKYGCKL